MSFISVVPLKTVPCFVLKKVIELFYFGETKFATTFKGQMYKALKLLEVNVEIPTPSPRSATIPTPPVVSLGQVNNGKVSSSFGFFARQH